MVFAGFYWFVIVFFLVLLGFNGFYAATFGYYFEYSSLVHVSYQSWTGFPWFLIGIFRDFTGFYAVSFGLSG